MDALPTPEDLLSLARVLERLKLRTRGQLRGLIASGRFPPAYRATAKSESFWFARDVECFLYLQSRGCRVRAVREKTPEKKSGKKPEAP